MKTKPYRKNDKNTRCLQTNKQYEMQTTDDQRDQIKTIKGHCICYYGKFRKPVLRYEDWKYVCIVDLIIESSSNVTLLSQKCTHP
jgi:hypothetical protein